MKVVFLVYDSRSGSTLLSREIAESFDDVYVTPEIGFDNLFLLGSEGLEKRGWAVALQRLYDSHEFNNFDVPYGEALKVVDNNGCPLSLSEGVTALVNLYCSQHSCPAVSWVVVKNGSHLKCWEKIRSVFKEDFYMLHIVRDPRSVISSKLRTLRPYHSEEVMAWGGVVLAALRWKIYAKLTQKIKESNANFCELRYEDLVHDKEKELSRIAVFLSIPLRKSERGYSVPEAEKAIHKLVESDGMDSRRINGWKTQMSTIDQYRVEAVCKSGMFRYGYTCTDQGVFRKFAVCLSEAPSAFYKLMKHFLRIMAK